MYCIPEPHQQWTKGLEGEIFVFEAKTCSEFTTQMKYNSSYGVWENVVSYRNIDMYMKSFVRASEDPEKGAGKKNKVLQSDIERRYTVLCDELKA